MKYFWLSFLFFVVAYLVPLGGRPLVPDLFPGEPDAAG